MSSKALPLLTLNRTVILNDYDSFLKLELFRSLKVLLIICLIPCRFYVGIIVLLQMTSARR